jgi:TrmH family RNA methyltransferase
MQLIPEARLALSLLEKRKVREKEGKFVVEGERLIREAQDRIHYLIYCEKLPIVGWAEGKGIPAYKVSRKVFELLTSVETPQGALAVVRKPEYPLKDVFRTRNPLVVYCIEIQDPGNLGAIIRSADAVGAAGVLLSKGTVDLYNQKVVRSTMGSLFHLPVLEAGTVEEGIKILKDQGIKLLATDPGSKKDYWEADFKGPTAVLVGNEGAGLAGSILNECDEVIKIPMPGKAESLNAALATSIILYEALRQRWLKESRQ